MRLIDADALRAEFQAILDRGDMFCEYDIVGMVDKAPTIEPAFREVVAYECGQKSVERPTGHWVNGYKSFNCSVCGKIAYSWNHFGEYIQVKSNFCPNCGADMRKEAEND